MSSQNDVFISYSRRDKAFMQRLFEQLNEAGYTSWVDWEDIPKGVDWLEEIYRGIENANTFLFILSPDSLTSEVCHQEITHALAHHKRIVPVVHREVQVESIGGHWLDKPWEKDARTNWTAIRHINWLFFRQEDDVERAFKELMDTLRTDIDHVRAHTRLITRAVEWDNNGRKAAFLLRGEDLSEAETWLAESPDKDPGPTALQAAYIQASRAASQRRQRSLLAGVTSALVVTAALAILAFFLFQDAETQRQTAEDEADNRATAQAEALIAQGEALDAQATAEANLLEAWTTQSLFLADLARQSLEDGNPQQAILLASEALVNYPAVDTVEGQQALLNALHRDLQEVAYLPHPAAVNSLAWSRDYRQVLTASDDGFARVWDIEQPGQPILLPHEGPVLSATWSPDASRILTRTATGQVGVWALDDIDNPVIHQHEGPVNGAKWSQAGDEILSWSDDGVVHRWKLTAPDEPLALIHETPVMDVLWSADEQTIAVQAAGPFAFIYDLDEPDNPQLLQVETAEQPNIIDLAWNPAGTHIALATEGGDFGLWALADLTEPLVLDYAGLPVAELTWSPNGDKLMIQGEGLAAVWDLNTAEYVGYSPFDFEVGVRRNVWSPTEDGGLAYDWYGGVYLWDFDSSLFESGTYTYFAHDAAERAVNGAAWHHQTQGPLALYSWGEDGTFKIWNLFGPGDPPTVLGHTASVEDAAWDEWGTAFITLTDDNVVHVWRYFEGQIPLHPGDSPGSVGARFSGDGSTVVDWDTHGDIHLWPLSDPFDLSTFSDAAGREVLDVRWNPAETHLLAIYIDGAAVWEIANPAEPLFTLSHDGHWLRGGRWSLDGAHTLTWGDDGSARLWPMDDPSNPLIFSHESVVRGADWGADGARLLTWSSDGTAKIWSLADPANPLVFAHDGALHSARWSADGTRLLCQTNEAATIWATADPTTPLLRLPYEGLSGATWNADETSVLGWSRDAGARVWRLDAPDSPIDLPAGIRFQIEGGQWHPDGQRVLLWSVGGGQVWNVATGAVSGRFSMDGIGRVPPQWSADGKRLLVPAEGGTAIYHLDDLATPLLLPNLNHVEGARWSPDETQVLAWTSSRVEVWPVSVPELLALADDFVGRELTAEERAAAFLASIATEAP